MGTNWLRELVSLVEWLAWADGLVEKDEALLIKAHMGRLSGILVWDVTGLPAEKRQPVLDLIQQVRNGTHPAFTGPDYQPARKGEPAPDLPAVVTTLVVEGEDEEHGDKR